MPARKVIPIDYKKWTFCQADDPASKWLPVSRMPTNIHLDLQHHGIIADPYVGKQENDCQWVGESKWIYKAVFPSPELTFGQKAVLAFDGLDTYATVVLNGKEILKTKDMFIPERVDVLYSLHSGKENVLEITFDSTYLIGKKIVEQYPNHKWGCWNGDPSRLAVRKAQYHYGWDWGCALLSCGPWRSVFLEVYHSRISDLYFTTHIEKPLKSAEVVAKADIEGEGEEVKFEISIDGKTVGTETIKIENGFATATFKTNSPKLWYPHTYGQQPLYVLKAELLRSKCLLDTASKRFGLRRAEVIQRKLEDSPGTTFLFEINNIPIFCGGSNWIPGEFGPMDPPKYHDWIKMVADGNQVMIRVWGGGIFEDNAFYEACDEMGVLVWQDFLFACGNYPAHQEFLALVKREATENVKLLRHHPSIVIWAGNNEDYQYCETEDLKYDPNDPNPESWLKTTFPARYTYEKILLEVTKELIPGTFYHYGSPYGGKDTTDPHVGDIHQWNIWHGTQEKYQDFDKLSGRFVSEFGMEAYPNIETVEVYLPKGRSDIDRYPQSSTVEFHNKATGNERRLALYLAENIPYTMAPFEQYIYCTQLMQAECVSSAYKLWKRQWKGPGREYCSGALVWQINDVWPGQSWSIVDYYLRPKLAYYAIKRELRPVTLGLKRTVHTIPADKYTRAYTKTIHKIQLWACNLSLETSRPFILIKSHNLITGQTSTWDDLKYKLDLPPNRSTEIDDFEISVFGHYPDEPTKPPDGAFSSAEEEQQQTVIAAYIWDSDGEFVARAVNWPEPLKYAHLPKPKDIKLELTNSLRDGPELDSEPAQDAIVVIVSSDVAVKGLCLEVMDPLNRDSEVVFEDNCVDLMPEDRVHIGVKGLKCGDEGRLKVRYLGM